MFKNVRSLLPIVFCLVTASIGSYAQDARSLTPRQLELEKLSQQLNSADVEDRRDALMKLRAMHRPEASRLAQSALTDPLPMIRATAAAAVVSLPADEAAGALLPLLNDKDEFVRQQVAYTLGTTHSRAAVTPLTQALVDKMDSVRAAAAIALGEIADPAAVIPLADRLSGRTEKKGKAEKNEFVMRAAARSLGQIGSRAAVPVLIEVVSNEKTPFDVRREAAHALGMLGDATALPVLHAASSSTDVYFSRAAMDAVRRINGGS
jgi:HEAT repeat protein